MSTMLDTFDPLNRTDSQLSEEEKSGYGTPTGDAQFDEVAVSQVEQASAVLGWSMDQVTKWLQKGVSFEQDRMQEFVRIFNKENVDGLKLLTLQRSHNACKEMNDTEWLLLKASRRRLMKHGDNGNLSEFSKIAVEEEVFDGLTPPATPPCNRGATGAANMFNGVREFHDAGLLDRLGSGVYLVCVGVMPRMIRLAFDCGMIETLRDEVLSLRGEIVASEERETTLQAQLDHLDDMLRTCQLSGYIHTRTRWTALPGEPPILDDTEVDDWTLRFLVLKGSTVSFYVRATDLHPQGTILLQEVVDAGPIPRKMHHKGDRRWSAFQITTCHGLRLECSSLLKNQVDSWLTAIGTSCIKIERQKSETLLRPLSGVWLKILPVDTEDCLSQEIDLFGAKV